MNQLVFINNEQVVTDSVTVAGNFEKRHDNVMRDIENLKKDVLNFEEMFFETTTPDSYGRERRTYLMNRDGFTLLAMGFTGRKAIQFKLKYIEAFNEMEKQLQQPRVLSDKEQLMASMRLSLEAAETLEKHDERIKNLENNMRIDSAQEQTIRKRANRAVVESLGGKSSPAYKTMAFKVFSAFWRDFKNHFEIPRYGDLPKKKFEEGLRFIDMWQPSTSLKIEIDNVNRQLRIEGVI
jgi:Rha family phage regulatory protein